MKVHQTIICINWVHLDNAAEVEAAGTHIEPPPQMYRLPIWLQTKHSLSNVSEQIKNDSIQEIAEVAFGGISNMYDFIVRHAKAPQLQHVQQIIQKNKLKHDELERMKKSQNEAAVDISVDDDEDMPKISSFSELPSDTITYISGFLNKKDIQSLKQTCYKNGIVCLQEMRKYNIGILNTNDIINDNSKRFVDLVGVAPRESFNYSRHISSTPYSDLLQFHENMCNIPKKKQFVQRKYNCKCLRQPPLGTIVRHHWMSKHLFLFDQRHSMICSKK